MKFKVPGAASYATLTAGTLDTGSSDTAGRYQGFVNVTGLVAAAGSGVYWVGDVQAGTGLDRYGGWALVVVYRDPSQPARNLTVFDGLCVGDLGDSAGLDPADWLSHASVGAGADDGRRCRL